MNPQLKIGGGVMAACAALCAVSIVPALVAGTSVAAIVSVAASWEIGMLALAIPAAVGVYYLVRSWPKRKRGRQASAQVAALSDQACGCGGAGGTEDQQAAIACTLDATDFKDRVAGIRDLARRSLRHAARTPLSLILTYDVAALDEVKDLVAKEQRCCAFLHFRLESDREIVRLTIMAPKAAAEAADELFAHFAPELSSTKTVEHA